MYVAVFDEFLVAADDKDMFVFVVVTFVARMSPSIAQKICRRLYDNRVESIVEKGKITKKNKETEFPRTSGLCKYSLSINGVRLQISPI